MPGTPRRHPTQARAIADNRRPERPPRPNDLLRAPFSIYVAVLIGFVFLVLEVYHPNRGGAGCLDALNISVTNASVLAAVLRVFDVGRRIDPRL